MKTMFFTALAAAMLFAACGSKNENQANKMPGRAVFEANECALCHGDNGEGTNKAPMLRSLTDHWTKAKLVQYLKFPGKYADTDKRLNAQVMQYPTMMPNFNNLNDGDLSKLADYLLAL